jgi:hypothetical protein
MPRILSLEEPRPRGTVLGERADRRRVHEVEHFFRCKLCGGYLDARDLVWLRIRGAAAASRAGSAAVARRAPWMSSFGKPVASAARRRPRGRGAHGANAHGASLAVKASKVLSTPLMNANAAVMFSASNLISPVGPLHRISTSHLVPTLTIDPMARLSLVINPLLMTQPMADLLHLITRQRSFVVEHRGRRLRCGQVSFDRDGPAYVGGCSAGDEIH